MAVGRWPGLEKLDNEKFWAEQLNNFKAMMSILIPSPPSIPQPPLLTRIPDWETRCKAVEAEIDAVCRTLGTVRDDLVDTAESILQVLSDHDRDVGKLRTQILTTEYKYECSKAHVVVLSDEIVSLREQLRAAKPDDGWRLW